MALIFRVSINNILHSFIFLHQFVPFYVHFFQSGESEKNRIG